MRLNRSSITSRVFRFIERGDIAGEDVYRALGQTYVRSLDEAAEFWDTHDSADYEEYMRDVECEADIQRRVYLVSLDSDLYRKVSAIAQARGVSAETLVNLWVQEKAI